DGSVQTKQESGKWQKIILAAILIFLSGFSLYDSFALDGSLPLIQNHFVIRNSQTALINTFCSFAHSFSLAILWVLGDFIDRKILLSSSIGGWIVSCVLSSTAQQSKYWVFMTFRSLSSIFSAIFGVLIPVVLADLFDDKTLGKALMSLFLIESFTGIISASITSWFVTSALPWFSPLLIAPPLSLLLLPPLICLIKTRKRSRLFKKRSFRDSLKLFSIKSFLLMVMGQTFGMFNLKASTFWTPSFLLTAWSYAPSVFFGLSYPVVISINSFVSLLGSMLGLPIVMFIAHSWNFGTSIMKDRRNSSAFPIVVSIGSLITVLVYLVVLLSTGRNFLLSSISLFFTSFCSAAEGALGQLMMLIVVPRRSRSSAVSLSRLITGILTIPSAQFVGQLTDLFMAESDVLEDRFLSFRNALLFSWIFVLLCALSYSFVTCFYAQDAKRAKEMDEMDREAEEEADSLLRSIEARNSRMLRSAIHSPSLFLFSFGQEIILRRTSESLEEEE
ncbi:hypothetical protein PMAYCL1PPCAC_18029, partial [Pristionchus mayeri]